MACDALMALGCGLEPLGAARAVNDADGPLVFAGLAWLFPQLGHMVPVCLEPGLDDGEIERLAWNEVIAVTALLRAPPAARQAFAKAIAAAAPEPVLSRLQALAGRDPLPLFRQLRIPARARNTSTGTPFEEAVRRFREREV